MSKRNCEIKHKYCTCPNGHPFRVPEFLDKELSALHAPSHPVKCTKCGAECDCIRVC